MLEQLLESIRKANIARGHPLYLDVLIFRVRVRPLRNVRPRADEDGVLILKYLRLCVVLKVRKRLDGTR